MSISCCRERVHKQAKTGLLKLRQGLLHVLVAFAYFPFDLKCSEFRNLRVAKWTFRQVIRGMSPLSLSFYATTTVGTNNTPGAAGTSDLFGNVFDSNSCCRARISVARRFCVGRPHEKLL